eukprot:698190-Pleurochrysis_carterae.AAC.1
MDDLAITCKSIAKLCEKDRQTAAALLLSFYHGQSGTSLEASEVVKKLFFNAAGGAHCFHSCRLLDARELQRYGYEAAMGWLRDECVGVLVYRHAMPQRRGRGSSAFSEVLLIAVDGGHAANTVAAALMGEVWRQARERHSSWLLVRSIYVRVAPRTVAVNSTYTTT